MTDSPNQGSPAPQARPTPTPRVVVCPYCGDRSSDLTRCGTCGGRFDPLSRQSSQNAMGPWFIRDASKPHGPGCSLSTLRALIARGVIKPSTVLRGPTTNQFWTPASRVPGVGHLLGACHACGASTQDAAFACGHCGAGFHTPEDRQHMGLMEARVLPGQASATRIAALTGDSSTQAFRPAPAFAGTPEPFGDLPATEPLRRRENKTASTRNRPFAAWLLGALLLIGFGVGGWSLRGVMRQPGDYPGYLASKQGSRTPDSRAGEIQRPSGVSPQSQTTVGQGGSDAQSPSDLTRGGDQARDFSGDKPDQDPIAIVQEIPDRVRKMVDNGDLSGATAAARELLEDSPSQELRSIGQSLDTALTAESLRSLP